MSASHAAPPASPIPSVIAAAGADRAHIELRRLLLLHLSEDTVKTYARRLYANLGVRDRAHAVARSFQLGILVVDEHYAEGRMEPVGLMPPPRSIGSVAPIGLDGGLS